MSFNAWHSRNALILLLALASIWAFLSARQPNTLHAIGCSRNHYCVSSHGERSNSRLPRHTWYFEDEHDRAHPNHGKSDHDFDVPTAAAAIHPANRAEDEAVFSGIFFHCTQACSGGGGWRTNGHDGHAHSARRAQYHQSRSSFEGDFDTMIYSCSKYVNQSTKSLRSTSQSQLKRRAVHLDSAPPSVTAIRVATVKQKPTSIPHREASLTVNNMNNSSTTPSRSNFLLRAGVAVSTTMKRLLGTDQSVAGSHDVSSISTPPTARFAAQYTAQPTISTPDWTPVATRVHAALEESYFPYGHDHGHGHGPLSSTTPATTPVPASASPTPVPASAPPCESLLGDTDASLSRDVEPKSALSPDGGWDSSRPRKTILDQVRQKLFDKMPDDDGKPVSKLLTLTHVKLTVRGSPLPWQPDSAYTREGFTSVLEGRKAVCLRHQATLTGKNDLLRKEYRDISMMIDDANRVLEHSISP